MKRQQGFTLIELVAVIVLLGILAVTALPRFVNLQGDARASVLRGISGSMQAAAAQIYAKALVQGLERAATGTLDNYDGNGTDLDVVYGYPTPTTIQNVVQLDTAENDTLIWYIPAGNTTQVLVGYDRNDTGTLEAADGCYATYTQATQTVAAAAVITDIDGC